MVLLTNITVMLIAMFLGTHGKRLRVRHVVLIAFLTLVQTLVAAYSMFHMEQPPLF